MKEYEKALNTLLKRSVGHNSNFMVAFNYAKTGQTEKAREILDYLVQLPDDKAPPTTQIGIVYLGLEDYNNAIKWFQKGLQTNDQWYVWMEQSWADPIKNDPRYIDLINSIKSEFDL
jgi:tetratricopeptide (TPR) repeat protein